MSVSPVGRSASELARAIAGGELTAVEAVESHIRRIEHVDQRLNAVVVRRFEHALEEAEAADRAQASGAALGRLHGVPITIKECFHLAGTPSSIGVGRLADEIIGDDSVIVSRLRRAGAIILGKTNIPQLMLLYESDNPVYGRTNNPWNLARSCGGSTGGEAAILAAHGSPLGLASDLGGSIRQPAHCCGVFGIKPTSGRLSTLGSRTNLRGMETIGVQPGPMARSTEDLYLGLQVMSGDCGGIVERHEMDEVDAPLGDPRKIDPRNLRIGMFVNDGYFTASPAIERVVREAADALRQRGATIVPFEPLDSARMMRLYLGLISADGGADFFRLLGNSRRDWRIRRLLRIGRMRSWTRLPLATLLRAAGQHGLVDLIRYTGRQSADGYWRLTAERAEYIQQFFGAMDAAGLDAILCPPHGVPALRHGDSTHLTPAASYCFLPNLLGCPAGVVPAGRVESGEESRRPVSRDSIERAAARTERDSAGLPVGVQVLARLWREDVALAIMGELEAAFRRKPGFPSSPPL